MKALALVCRVLSSVCMWMAIGLGVLMLLAIGFGMWCGLTDCFAGIPL